MGAFVSRSVEAPGFPEADLAFVNRGAEVLDILVPNLLNQQQLSGARKMKTPVAAQPQGTGKTALGLNICNALRRPRERTAPDEEIAARRLRAALTWSDVEGSASPRCFLDARKDPSNDNLLMRVLLHRFPHLAPLLRVLQKGKPLIVRMQDLDSSFPSLDEAIGYALFKAHTGSTALVAFAAFIAQSAVVSGRAANIASAIVCRSGGCAMIVLDDINALGDDDFIKWWPGAAGTPTAVRFHLAMKKLSPCLDRLHRTPGCLVYATGRSLSLAFKALAGDESPLFQSPVILQPLAPHDVLDTLRHTLCASGRTLLDEIGVVPALHDYFAHQCASSTGGVGRVLEYLLKGLLDARTLLAGSTVVTTKAGILAAIEAVRVSIDERISASLRLRIDWDGPLTNTGAVDVELQKLSVEKEVLRMMVHALLMNAPCTTDTRIRAGATAVSMMDAAVVLGLSYAPSLVAIDPADDEPLSDAALAGAQTRVPQPGRVVIIAGDWLCLALREDPRVISDAELSASATLLYAMRSFAGTMRGRPFELLCVQSLCSRSFLSPGHRLCDMLPHLALTLIGQEVVPALRVVFLPKVISTANALSPADKLSILGIRSRWTGPTQITPVDLAWALTDWLEPGTIALPRNYQSGSQDFVLRLGNRFLGVANKADGPKPGTQWAKIVEELQKAPTLVSPYTYTLVLWTLNLGNDVSKTIAGPSRVLGTGTWFASKGKLSQGDHAVNKKTAVLHVAVRSELVLVNPRFAGPAVQDGLGELLGPHIRAQLDALQETGECDIAVVDGWLHAPAGPARREGSPAKKQRLGGSFTG